MVFEKNTTPEVVKVLCSNLARTFLFEREIFPFKKFSIIFSPLICLASIVFADVFIE